ncbi:hypothetical protein E2A64_10080 [Pseudohoeflea suaedae]|uniref:Uncharacterized protein n=1 Tax=Pseudohoeflea suaedae TaxID=877384 RepID=A0A4R5PJ56_9HYPH|nr:hypothetical protein [Pseudohoeflea suaedae]TDH35679.1 hypothetical protein E2A64_10080 [Pseudohoeflea suaedae]
MIEKVARGQSKFDGREWLSMPRTERERYMARARIAVADMREAAPETTDLIAAARGKMRSFVPPNDSTLGAALDAAIKVHFDAVLTEPPALKEAP